MMSPLFVPQARATAEGLLAPLKRRWRHVQGVARRAQRFTAGLDPAASDVLVASAWLHDVGYAPDLVNTGLHPLDGARFLRNNGWPTDVVELVAHHSGAEIEAEERGLAAEMAEFSRPPQELLDRLTAVDMTTSPDGEPIPARQRITEILERYKPDHVVHRAVSRSGPMLIETAERVQAELRVLGVELDLPDERGGAVRV